MPDVSELKRLYDEYNNQEARTLTIGGSKGFSFKVKYRLNMDEATALVHEVCNGVFDPGVCEYRPELKDYCLRAAVIRAYTDIELPPYEESWNLVYGTPIFALITGCYNHPTEFRGREYEGEEVIDMVQYEQILKSIDDCLNYEISWVKHRLMYLDAVDSLMTKM